MIKSFRGLLLLGVLLIGLGGCVYDPYYDPFHARDYDPYYTGGRYPGYYDYYYREVPGASHYYGYDYGPGREWVPGRWDTDGNWIPGHWRR